MPRIEQSVQIQAPIAHVYHVARNVEAFPEYMPDLQSLTVLERSADGGRTVTQWAGLIRDFKMTVRWTQEDLWDEAAYRDDFKMLQGDMDRMEGSWVFADLGDGRTRFDSVVDYEYNVPLIGPLVKSLIHNLMTRNLKSTLDAIKSKAEETRPS